MEVVIKRNSIIRDSINLNSPKIEYSEVSRITDKIELISKLCDKIILESKTRIEVV